MVFCEFCDIAAGKSPETVIEFENDELVIFEDIRPNADYHFLAIPKVHYTSLESLNKLEHLTLIDNLEKALKDLILSKSLNIDDAVFGFHVPPLISVWHLHLHALAPVSSIIPRARYKYTPSEIFLTPERAKQRVELLSTRK